MHPAEAECVTIQDSPSGSTVAQVCENKRDSSPVFDVLHGWVTWILKCIPLTADPLRAFSTASCFVLFWFPLPPSFPQNSSKCFWWRGNGPDGLPSICMRFYFWKKNGRAQLVYSMSFFFFFFLRFQCSWFVIGWWFLEPWLRILIMTLRSGQRDYWEVVSC